MRFKDLVVEDNAAIIDLDEMAEYVICDNVIMKAIVTKTTERMSGVESKNYGGLYGDYITLWFKAEDYCRKRERLPRQGEYCYLQSKRYEVISSIELDGIGRLEMRTYRQNTLRKAAQYD